MSIVLTQWRDRLDEAKALPGMALGTASVRADAAERLFAAGVRQVDLRDTVDLSGGAPPEAVAALTLVRDLTGMGVEVRWRLAYDGGGDLVGDLGHLHPPAQILGPADAADIRRRWREDFFLCKCVHRRGPGFVQVRDRRSGRLHLLTIDEPDYLRAIDVLLAGARAGKVPPDIVGAFEQERLVATVGGILWWLPYRVRRWPLPAMTV